jgi:hypothetical protein
MVNNIFQRKTEGKLLAEMIADLKLRPIEAPDSTAEKLIKAETEMEELRLKYVAKKIEVKELVS